MSEAAKWYVVHTYSGYENKVAQNIEKVVENRKLQDLIQEVRVPTQLEDDIASGKQREHLLFPGYVLIKMIVTDDTWYIVRNTRGCTGFVGPASAPTPLTEEEVEKTFGIDLSTPVVDVSFKVGDNVRITGTVMDGVIGVVQNINIEDRTVDILVSMLGRETMATLPLSQVAEVD